MVTKLAFCHEMKNRMSGSGNEGGNASSVAHTCAFVSGDNAFWAARLEEDTAWAVWEEKRLKEADEWKEQYLERCV